MLPLPCRDGTLNNAQGQYLSQGVTGALKDNIYHITLSTWYSVTLIYFQTITSFSTRDHRERPWRYLLLIRESALQCYIKCLCADLKVETHGCPGESKLSIWSCITQNAEP